MCQYRLTLDPENATLRGRVRACPRPENLEMRKNPPSARAVPRERAPQRGHADLALGAAALLAALFVLVDLLARA